MIEELITLYTAKLAKEIGFYDYCRHSYWKGRLTCETPGFEGLEGRIESYLRFERFYAPTQSKLQRWLREKHNIDVIVYPSFMGKEKNYYYVIFKNRDFDNPMQGHTNNYSYEEALELGLIESLKLFKYIRSFT